jgi:hypothetical protein
MIHTLIVFVLIPFVYGHTHLIKVENSSFVLICQSNETIYWNVTYGGSYSLTHMKSLPTINELFVSNLENNVSSYICYNDHVKHEYKLTILGKSYEINRNDSSIIFDVKIYGKPIKINPPNDFCGGKMFWNNSTFFISQVCCSPQIMVSQDIAWEVFSDEVERYTPPSLVKYKTCLLHNLLKKIKKTIEKPTFLENKKKLLIKLLPFVIKNEHNSYSNIFE